VNKGFYIYAYLTFLILLVHPAITNSEEPNPTHSNHWYTGIILDLGVTFSQVRLIVEKYENGSIVSDGKLKSETDYSPFINIGSPYRYFGKTKFGYNIQLTYSSFNVDKQEIGNDELKDHGTSANGYFIYGMPVFFYNVGDKYLNNGKGKSIKFGVGVGLGYLVTDGDIILENTKDGSQEDHSFDYRTDLVDIAAYVLTDIRINKLIVRIRGGGPQTIENVVDGYGYGLFDFSIAIGYFFEL